MVWSPPWDSQIIVFCLFLYMFCDLYNFLLILAHWGGRVAPVEPERGPRGAQEGGVEGIPSNNYKKQ